MKTGYLRSDYKYMSLSYPFFLEGRKFVQIKHKIGRVMVKQIG